MTKRIGRVRAIEFSVLSELMRNSRVSDRELARKLKKSQPTMSRIRAKLEREGYIREYTLIPDFTKLGYEIASVVFVRSRYRPTQEEIGKIREIAHEWEKKLAFSTIMAIEGEGLGHQAMLVSFHKNYASYREFIDQVKSFPYIDVENVQSFLIGVKTAYAYRSLTFSTLAKDILTMRRENQQ